MLNNLQPIILYVAIKHFNKNLDDKSKNILDGLFLIYIANLLHYSKEIYPLECTEVTPDSDPYLRWDWNYKKSWYFYLIFIVVLIVFEYIGLEKPYNLFIALGMFISIIATRIITRDKKALGAIWCWFGAIAPVILLLVDMYKEKYDNNLKLFLEL
jgi:hypothetical protein